MAPPSTVAQGNGNDRREGGTPLDDLLPAEVAKLTALARRFDDAATRFAGLAMDLGFGVDEADGVQSITEHELVELAQALLERRAK